MTSAPTTPSSDAGHINSVQGEACSALAHTPEPMSSSSSGTGLPKPELSSAKNAPSSSKTRLTSGSTETTSAETLQGHAGAARQVIMLERPQREKRDSKAPLDCSLHDPFHTLTFVSPRHVGVPSMRCNWG